MTRAEIAAAIKRLAPGLTGQQFDDALLLVSTDRRSVRSAIETVTKPKRRVTWRAPDDTQ